MPEKDYDTPQRETQVNSAFYRLEAATEGLTKEVERLEARLSSVRAARPKNLTGGALASSQPASSAPLALRIDKTSSHLYALLERLVALQAELEL